MDVRHPFSFHKFVSQVIRSAINRRQLQGITLLRHLDIEGCGKEIPVKVIYDCLAQFVLLGDAEIVWSFMFWYLFCQFSFKAHSNTHKRDKEAPFWLCRHHVIQLPRTHIIHVSEKQKASMSTHGHFLAGNLHRSLQACWNRGATASSQLMNLLQ